MGATRSKQSVNLTELLGQVVRQFRGLDPNDPSRWPMVPRALLLLVAAGLVIVLLWYAVIANQVEQLELDRQRESELKAQYTDKVTQAVAVDLLKSQLEQVRQYVAQLERQLPSRAEMDALLSDINQAGVGHGLQFELFRPGQEVTKDYYAELPITVKVNGSYHDIAKFASDIAHLSRIVTLNNIAIQPHQGRVGVLSMEAVAKTFRYLDPEELQAKNSAMAGEGARR